MKRQQRTTGAIVRIDLEDGFYNFAQILDRGVAFFYIHTKESQLDNWEVLLDTPVLFIIEIYNDVITKGRWLKVGKLPVRPDLKELPMKYIHDKLRPGNFEFYDPNTGEITPATREQILGLEVCAVWDYNHVEDRIRDHYNNVPCIWMTEEYEILGELDKVKWLADTHNLEYLKKRWGWI